VKCPPEKAAQESEGYGSHTRTDPGRGNGGDDEDKGSDFEGHGGEAEVVGSGRDYRGNGPDDAPLRERYQEHGYSGLWDYRKRSPRPKRIAVEVLERVPRLHREKYFDASCNLV
jgi:hypothetical protein